MARRLIGKATAYAAAKKLTPEVRKMRRRKAAARLRKKLPPGYGYGYATTK